MKTAGDAPRTDLTKKTIEILSNGEYAPLLAEIDAGYFHWDKVKYLAPRGVRPEDLWSAVKWQRSIQAVPIPFAGNLFFLKTTASMQEALHKMDLRFAGNPSGSASPSANIPRGCLLSSAMEEAIASSQMEGASTTRRVAKDMLRRRARPRNESEQMILNNYRTIRFVSERSREPLTPALLLEIHRRITEKTLKDPSSEGSFRKADNVFVANVVTGEIVHEPPPCSAIPSAVDGLCAFANGAGPFVHPIVRAILLHFFVSYLHPFADGNGRTARALFHWHMLRSGFRLAEYLSVSRVVQKTRGKYEKAFIHVERDGLDLGYFVQYGLAALERAFAELEEYLERKSKENEIPCEYLSDGISARQALIAKACEETPSKIRTCAEIAAIHGVTAKTARKDLEALVKAGLLRTVPLNRRLTGYVPLGNSREI